MGFFKRGQAGIEYVTLVGLLLIFLIPMIHYGLNQASNQVKISQVDNFVRRIAKGVDAVAAMGPGTQEIVTVTLPMGVRAINVTDSLIRVSVEYRGNVSDISMPTKALTNGSLPIVAGTYDVRLTAWRTYVNISKEETVPVEET